MSFSPRTPERITRVDADRFDDVSRLLIAAPTRRRTVLGIAAAAIGAAMPPSASARKDKKRKKPRLNEFGCVNVGGACFGKDDLCCSGLCAGKKPKKGKRDKRRCVGHDQGNCQPGQNSCPALVACEKSSGGAGNCFRTTGNAGFCTADLAAVDSPDSCTKDDDCVERCGSGAACIVDCQGDPVCVGLGGSDSACGLG